MYSTIIPGKDNWKFLFTVFPDDSKYEIVVPEANLTEEEKADAKIGETLKIP